MSDAPGDYAFHMYVVDRDGRRQDYVSLVPPHVAHQSGLQQHMLMGAVTQPLATSDKITPDNFVVNPAFVEFLQRFVAEYAPRDPRMRDAARNQGTGWLYVIDQRTRDPGGNVPPEDIVGAFEVRKGEVAADSYKPNPRHLILTDDGFFRLDVKLQRILVKRLAST